NRRGEVERDHPASVMATWSLSFEQVERANTLAADLLRLCAFLSPDAIPDEVLLQAIPSQDGQAGAGTVDSFELNEALRTVSAYSLLRRQAEERICSMHRLVQAVLRDAMEQETQHTWKQRVIRALSAVFPEAEFEAWTQCERLLLHALAVADWIEEEAIL